MFLGFLGSSPRGSVAASRYPLDRFALPREHGYPFFKRGDLDMLVAFPSCIPLGVEGSPAACVDLAILPYNRALVGQGQPVCALALFLGGAFLALYNFFAQGASRVAYL